MKKRSVITLYIVIVLANIASKLYLRILGISATLIWIALLTFLILHIYFYEIYVLIYNFRVLDNVNAGVRNKVYHAATHNKSFRK